MRLTVQTFWPLALLAMIPFLWWVRRSTTMDLTAKHLRLLAIVRCAIVCLLTAALMQPVLYKPSAYVSVVYLLDASQSVAPGSIKKAIEWIQQTNDAGKPDHSKFIAFGANAMEFDKVDDLKKV